MAQVPIIKIFLISIITLTTLCSNAQKVGLVLSGGGSKGVAHIGVIRALEEAEIPIDYITGTSMGAIIGGLYAAGYSPDDMEDLISSPEFKFWSTGKLDPAYKYYFNSPAKNAGWIDLKFNVDSTIKPSIPTNIISPVMMDFAFLELFASASAASGYNFDKLMVPFRCIASDISKAQSVVLDKGDLGSAIRASMTFPFYFKPIMIDTVLLFDGGMYNNFPSDVMLDVFNPDIIIGSQASANAKAPQANNVLSHIENMLMMKSNFNVICDNSVMIKPNIPDVNVVDFSHTEAFIDSGYIQAKRMIPEIRQFVVDSRSKHAVDSLRRAFNSTKPELNIGTIEIKGLRKSQFHYMKQLLNRNAIINPMGVNVPRLTLQMVKPQYYRFIAEGRIGSIYPRMTYHSGTGDYSLEIDIEHQNQLITEIGGAITSSSVNELFVQLKYFLWTSRSIHFTANSYFGRFYNSALLETRIDIPDSKPYFLSAGFVFNKFNYFKTLTFFYADEDPYFLIEKEQFGYLSIGIPVKNYGKIVFDLPFGVLGDWYYQTNTYSRLDVLDRTSFNFIAPGVLFEIYSLTHKEYANSGVNLKAQVNIVTGTEYFYPGTTAPVQKNQKIVHSWVQGKVEYENYFAKYKKLTFGLYSSLNYSNQYCFTNYTSSILSATPFQPIPESTIRFMPQFRANKFIAIGSKNVLSLTNSFDFRLEGYIMIAEDALINDMAVPATSSALKLNPMASSVLVYRTPIGPLSMDLNYFFGEEKPLSFFLKLGYLIFNRRPF